MTSSIAAASIFGMSLVATTSHNEGTSYKAYRDSAGVLTICQGETHGVKEGEVRTKAQCDAQLKKSLAEHAKALNGIPSSISDVTAMGAIDLAYNIGETNFNNSSVKKAIIDGNYKLAGERTLAWKYITVTHNGKRVKYDCSKAGNGRCAGLWKRRQWQAKAIGNEYKNVTEAVNALNH